MNFQAERCRTIVQMASTWLTCTRASTCKHVDSGLAIDALMSFINKMHCKALQCYSSAKLQTNGMKGSCVPHPYPTAADMLSPQPQIPRTCTLLLLTSKHLAAQGAYARLKIVFWIMCRCTAMLWMRRAVRRQARKLLAKTW